MNREPDVGFDPGSPGSAPWTKGRCQTAKPPRAPPWDDFACPWELGPCRPLSSGRARRLRWGKARPGGCCVEPTTSGVSPPQDSQWPGAAGSPPPSPEACVERTPIGPGAQRSGVSRARHAGCHSPVSVPDPAGTRLFGAGQGVTATEVFLYFFCDRAFRAQ